MKFLRMLCLIPVLFSVGASAQTGGQIKRQIQACHDRKLNELKVRQPFSQRGDVVCPPGDWVDFPPRCRTDDRNTTVVYTAPSGNKIIASSVDVVSQTSRTSMNGHRFDGQTASVNLACNGHGCGGEGRVWLDVALNGTIERIPTDDDRKRIIDQCMDEVLK